MKLAPAFAAASIYSSIGWQITRSSTKQFEPYEQLPVSVHGSTLDMIDMPPDSTYDWVMAVTKPDITPAIFNFTFAEDQGNIVNAAAIF